jgi:hypothetical protein
LSADARKAGRRFQIVDEAIRANKIPESRREYYEREWDLNPVATEAVLRELAPGVPVPESLLAEGEGLPVEWFDRRGPHKQMSGPISAEQDADSGGLPWVSTNTRNARQGRTIAGDA